MSDLITNPPVPPCYSPVPETGIRESQSLDPDLFSPRARDARGRFAAGRSGNPRGRPRGIPNPRRRLVDLRVRAVEPAVLSALVERKPFLLRPLAAQLLPPPRPPADPAELLGIDVASVRTADDLRRVAATVWAAIARGDIAPAEGLRVVRRARARLRAVRRALRRLAGLRRRLARLMPEKTAPALPPIG